MRISSIEVAFELSRGPDSELRKIEIDFHLILSFVCELCRSEPRSTPVPPLEDVVYPENNSPDSSIYGSEDEEQEDLTQYRRGGYHPINLGDVLQCRYRVVRKLGWGHFSTVWLCKDLDEDKYVALKVVKSAQHYAETAADEIRLLQVIKDADPFDSNRDRIVKLLNHFTARGVNGTHTCLVFEALGCSLYKLIVKNNYQGLAIGQVKSIIRQVSCWLERLLHYLQQTHDIIQFCRSSKACNIFTQSAK